jgi:hypothetical protein
MPKGTITPGSEIIVPFIFKKPAKDPLLKDIDFLIDIGMWVTCKAELKISGGYIPANSGIQEITTAEIIFKAYVENI